MNPTQDSGRPGPQANFLCCRSWRLIPWGAAFRLRRASLSLLLLAAFAAPSAAFAADFFSVHGSYDLIVALPEKLRLREYFSPRKYPNLPGREYPSGTFAVQLESHPASWIKLYSLSLFDTDGTALNTEGGIYNYNDVFQHKLYGAKFEEDYADLNLGPVGLKIGLQKFAWGKLDAFAPNDVLNPLEAYNPFLSGLAGIRDSEIGIPAAQLGWYSANSERKLLPPELTVQAVWIPFYVPPRVDFIGERWFPPTLQANNQFQVNGTPVNLHLALRNAPPPARRMNQPSAGLRVAGTWASLDADLYYYYGYQTGFRAIADAQVILARLLPLPTLGADVNVTALPLFRRFQDFGAAAAMPLGPFGVRAELAYQKNRLFGRDLSTVLGTAGIEQQLLVLVNSLGRRSPLSLPPLELASDAILAGVSADYSLWGNFILVQLNQTDILHGARNLIVRNPETVAIATIRRSMLQARLQFMINGLYSFPGAYSFLEPTIAYSFTDAWSATLGYLKISGPEKSLLGQFHDNDEIFLRARYSF